MVVTVRDIACALAAMVCAGTLSTVHAEYPDRTMRILVPFTPGGGTDILARMIGQKMTDAWGQPVVVENRPGANGIVAAEITARSNPDGYSLLFVAIGHAINPLLQKKLPYDTEKDFTPVSLTAILPLVAIVHPSVKATTVKELLALAKSGKTLTYASGGVGSSQHLATELMLHMAGVKMTHVPYKGGNQGLLDLVGGHVEVMVTGVLTAVPQVQAGKARALAVTTAQRNSALPGVPTMAEAGLKGYESVAWYGMVAPAGLPPAVLTRLAGVVTSAPRSADMRDALIKQGAEPVGSTPKEFGAFIRKETARYSAVIKEKGVMAE